MVAGMLPLALVLDPGAQAAASLGTVVIGGLLSSLLLTLLLVPVVYVALAGDVLHTGDDLGESRIVNETPLVDATTP
jgi:Cu/Ag efflux pump CusA